MSKSGLLKYVLDLCFIMLFLMLVMFTWVYFEQKPINDFCSTIPASSTLEEVVASAEKEQFIPLKTDESGTRLTVLNQLNLFGLYSCEVVFQRGRVVSANVFMAD